MTASQLADRERMKTLLVEAIATLCRNGLQYEEELSVEGLIGITLDKKDVFLVSVKESFVVPGKKAKEATTVSSPDTEQAEKKRKKRRRSGSTDGETPHKHKRKGESMLHPGEGATDESDAESGVERLQSEPSVEDEPFEHNNRSSTDHERIPAKPPDDDSVVVIDPDLSIKQEIIKQEKHCDPTRTGSEDDPGEEPGVIFAQEVNPDSDPNLPVFSSAPVPVNLFSTSPSTSRGSLPGQWPPFAHQAPGTPGASQEVASTPTKIKGTPKEFYYCEECDKNLFLTKRGIHFHRERHNGVTHQCPFCDFVTEYKHKLKPHIVRIHYKNLPLLDPANLPPGDPADIPPLDPSS